MHSKYDQSQEYFGTAYRTGSDVWTHIPFQAKAEELTDKLAPNAFILDLGSGRGKFPFQLAAKGFRVIGLDSVSAIVAHGNAEIKDHGQSEVMRFVEGDALDIPFAEESFDAVTDVGLLQHLSPDDWQQYVSEVDRVVKPMGYYFLIAFSRETAAYLNWTPKKDAHGDYEYEGVFHHFFTEDEIRRIFEEKFEIISLRIEHVPAYHNVAFIVALMRK